MKALVLLRLALGFALCACEQTPCPPFGKPPVLVVITAPGIDGEVCDATVTIASSQASQQLTRCPYAGGSGPAPFRVTVDRGGFNTATIEAITPAPADNQCPAQAKVDVLLVPTP